MAAVDRLDKLSLSSRATPGSPLRCPTVYISCARTCPAGFAEVEVTSWESKSITSKVATSLVKFWSSAEVSALPPQAQAMSRGASFFMARRMYRLWSQSAIGHLPSEILCAARAFVEAGGSQNDLCPGPGRRSPFRRRAAHRRGLRPRHHRLDGRRDRGGQGEDRRDRAQHLGRAAAARRALRHRRLPTPRRRVRDADVRILARARRRAGDR